MNICYKKSLGIDLFKMVCFQFTYKSTDVTAFPYFQRRLFPKFGAPQGPGWQAEDLMHSLVRLKIYPGVKLNESHEVWSHSGFQKKTGVVFTFYKSDFFQRKLLTEQKTLIILFSSRDLPTLSTSFHLLEVANFFSEPLFLRTNCFPIFWYIQYSLN